MKIRMKTLAAGADGVLQPGQEVDLPLEVAKQYIAGGYAVPVRGSQERATARSSEATVLLQQADALRQGLGISPEIAQEMASQGIVLAKIAAVDDKTLLSITGIGPARLRKIREKTGGGGQ